MGPVGKGAGTLLEARAHMGSSHPGEVRLRLLSGCGVHSHIDGGDPVRGGDRYVDPNLRGEALGPQGMVVVYYIPAEPAFLVCS